MVDLTEKEMTQVSLLVKEYFQKLDPIFPNDSKYEGEKTLLGNWDVFVKDCQGGFDGNYMQFRSCLADRLGLALLFREKLSPLTFKKLESHSKVYDKLYRQCSVVVNQSVVYSRPPYDELEETLYYHKPKLLSSLVHSEISYLNAMEITNRLSCKSMAKLESDLTAIGYSQDENGKVELLEVALWSWEFLGKVCRYGARNYSLQEFEDVLYGRLELEMLFQSKFANVHSDITALILEADARYFESTVQTQNRIQGRRAGCHKTHKQIELMSRLPKIAIGAFKRELEENFGYLV